MSDTDNCGTSGPNDSGHANCLKYFCRLCGEICNSKFLKNPKLFRNSGWKNKTAKDVDYILKNIYGIDTSKDRENVHPPKICNKCKDHVNAWEKPSKPEKKMKATFIEHSLDCKVCKIYHEKLEESDCQDSTKLKRKTLSTQNENLDSPSNITEDTKLEQPSVKGSPTFRDIVEHKQKVKTEKEEKRLMFNSSRKSLSSLFSENEDKLQNQKPESDQKVYQELETETVPMQECPKCKMVLLSENFDSHCLECNVEIFVYSLERFVDSQCACEFVCSVCYQVPVSPVPIITECEHLFCRSCLSRWIFQEKSNSTSVEIGVCPCCRSPLGDVTDLFNKVASLPLKNLLQCRLKLKCPYADSWKCDFVSEFQEMRIHDQTCESRFGSLSNSDTTRRKRSRKGIAGQKKATADEKTPLKDNDFWYNRKCLNHVISVTDSVITESKENNLDCKYFLIDQLRKENKREEAKEVSRIWHHGATELTIDQCLALKVKNLMSDRM